MSTPPRAPLRLVESFLDRLRASPEGDPADALSWLVRSLPATGACVVEWPQVDEPVMLAVAGLIQDVSRHAGFSHLTKLALAGSAGTWSSCFEGPPAFCMAVTCRPPARPIGLVVWGDLEAHPEHELLLRSLLGLIDQCLSRRAPAAPEVESGDGLVFPTGYVSGTSPALQELYRQMTPLQQGDLPVLIVGETGVGKEHVARMLHASSRRKDGPFVALNCAAIPADLLEAELFGVAKGAATGVAPRAGKFQLAEGGTLFLDEIGDMSQDLQAKLLRALQEKEVLPVGGPPVKTDIRILSATNSDLRRRMEEGHLRSDLFYRVAGFVLRVPPLRERQGHIPQLVEDFLRRFAAESGKHVRGITVDALRSLAAYTWPGNVRELEHEVRRLVYVCPDGHSIDETMVSPRVLAGPVSPSPVGAAGPPADGSLDLGRRVAELERRLIEEALERTHGNRTQAARLLGISRNGLAIKIERLQAAKGAPESGGGSLVDPHR